MIQISIHSLREEGDGDNVAMCFSSWDISIHSLREEGDRTLAVRCTRLLEFQSTPSVRRETLFP